MNRRQRARKKERVRHHLTAAEANKQRAAELAEKLPKMTKQEIQIVGREHGLSMGPKLTKQGMIDSLLTRLRVQQ